MKNSLLLSVLISKNLLFSLSCSHQEEINSSNDLTHASEAGDVYVTLEFPRSSSKLQKAGKDSLNALAIKSKEDGREIEDIKVLVWSDKEYPQSAKRGNPRDVILAKERGQAIKDYLQDELHAQEVIGTFNMARKPGLLSRLTQNEDWKLKEAFKENQATASQLPDGSVSYTKASKALVIIDYKDE